jgi:rubrerythrin
VEVPLFGTRGRNLFRYSQSDCSRRSERGGDGARLGRGARRMSITDGTRTPKWNEASHRSGHEEAAAASDDRSLRRQTWVSRERYLRSSEGAPSREPSMSHTCPVCGYPNLRSEPWRGDLPSDEICPSCGTHFGYEDFAGGDPTRRPAEYASLRAKWKAAGFPWFSPVRHPPQGWDPRAQLARIERSQ